MDQKIELQEIHKHVRERYGDVADKGHTEGACCDTSCCGGNQLTQIASVARLYDAPDATELPDEVTGLSLGCGDPVTIAELSPGETVVDLGSGGGIDCFLAAKRVGPTGRVIGVDMTSSMLDRARENKAKLGAENVEFRLGEIEHLPLADSTADVIISNCVINLSPDKPQVLREAYRVLTPGGRISISDIVTRGAMPQELKDSLSAWVGCVSGAIDESEYTRALEAAGFVDINLQSTNFDEDYAEDAIHYLEEQGYTEEVRPVEVQNTIFSARITAQKPTNLRKN